MINDGRREKAGRKWSMGRGGLRDLFLVGLRVLAIDDDPICLTLLGAFLLQCQYQVTIANKAIKVLMPN